MFIVEWTYGDGSGLTTHMENLEKSRNCGVVRISWENNGENSNLIFMLLVLGWVILLAVWLIWTVNSVLLKNKTSLLNNKFWKPPESYWLLGAWCLWHYWRCQSQGIWFCLGNDHAITAWCPLLKKWCWYFSTLTRLRNRRGSCKKAVLHIPKIYFPNKWGIKLRESQLNPSSLEKWALTGGDGCDDVILY